MRVFVCDVCVCVRCCFSWHGLFACLIVGLSGRQCALVGSVVSSSVSLFELSFGLLVWLWLDTRSVMCMCRFNVCFFVRVLVWSLDKLFGCLSVRLFVCMLVCLSV